MLCRRTQIWTEVSTLRYRAVNQPRRRRQCQCFPLPVFRKQVCCIIFKCSFKVCGFIRCEYANAAAGAPSKSPVSREAAARKVPPSHAVGYGSQSSQSSAEKRSSIAAKGLTSEAVPAAASLSSLAPRAGAAPLPPTAAAPAALSYGLTSSASKQGIVLLLWHLVSRLVFMLSQSVWFFVFAQQVL